LEDSASDRKEAADQDEFLIGLPLETHTRAVEPTLIFVNLGSTAVLQWRGPECRLCASEFNPVKGRVGREAERAIVAGAVRLPSADGCGSAAPAPAAVCRKKRRKAAALLAITATDPADVRPLHRNPQCWRGAGE